MTLDKVLLILELEDESKDDEQLLDDLGVNLLAESGDGLPVVDDGLWVRLVLVVKVRSELCQREKWSVEAAEARETARKISARTRQVVDLDVLSTFDLVLLEPLQVRTGVAIVAAMLVIRCITGLLLVGQIEDLLANGELLVHLSLVEAKVGDVEETNLVDTLPELLGELLLSSRGVEAAAREGGKRSQLSFLPKVSERALCLCHSPEVEGDQISPCKVLLGLWKGRVRVLFRAVGDCRGSELGGSEKVGDVGHVEKRRRGRGRDTEGLMWMKESSESGALRSAARWGSTS